jgi:hypothetical protein
MHAAAQAAAWDELTAIGTLALAVITAVAIGVTIVITVTDRRRADAQRTADRKREDDLRRADAAALEKRLQDERRERADQDALQVVVEFSPVAPQRTKSNAVTTGDEPTHRITVIAFASYQIRNINARMAGQSNSGLTIFGTGWSFKAPEFAEGLVRYCCPVSLNSQQSSATPVVRFTDANGWQYYWYRGNTRRFGQNTDFHEAAAEIDLWIRTGPNPDEPAAEDQP